VEEYLVDFNATRAAERAGYGGNSNVLAAQGSRLLKNVKISESISQHLQEKAMTADEVLMRLADQARANVTDFIQDYGAIDWEAVKAKGHVIKRISHKQGEHSTIELYDAQAALEKIGKAHGLFVDRQQQEGEFTLRIVRDGTDGQS